MDYTLNNGSCNINKKGCNCRSKNKLGTFDWLSDLPESMNETEYVEVQFKNTRKGYYLNSLKLATMQ